MGDTQSIDAEALVLACVMIEGAPTVELGSFSIPVGVGEYDRAKQGTCGTVIRRWAAHSPATLEPC